MSENHSKTPSRAEIEQAAAQRVLRRDRGLTAAEQDELSQWLAADPRHGEALALQRWGGEELDRLTGMQTSQGAVPDPICSLPVPTCARGGGGGAALVRQARDGGEAERRRSWARRKRRRSRRRASAARLRRAR